MDTEELQTEIEGFLSTGQLEALQARLADCDAPEIADALQALDPDSAMVLLRDLPGDRAATVFAHLPRQIQLAFVESLSPDSKRLAALLNDLSPDDRTAFFAELPEPVVQRFLSILDPKERAKAVKLLGYPERSVGRLATTDYIALRPDWTVGQALRHIRRFGAQSETINVIYVVDNDWKLLDDIRIRDILLADPDDSIESLMATRFVSLNADDEQEQAVTIFRDSDRSILPVVDHDGIMVGIVTFDDVLDVADEEATEDIQKIGGSEALDMPYMETSLFTLIKKRAGWLAILFIGEMFTATAMGYFEDEIARAVVLALFVPLVISSGGNSGSQAASIMIRALALGEVKLKDWWRVMHREIWAGLALGSILGAIGFLRVVIWANIFGIYGSHWLLLAWTIGLALIGVVLWGSLAGSMLPFIMKRIGTDPATSSAPFVATLVDVTGIIIYFSVAAIILTGTLL